MRPRDRERIQVEVVSRVVERLARKAQSSPDGFLETLVNDTLYTERQRLEREPRGSPAVRADAAFYDAVQKRFRHASERDLRDLAEELARRFAAEVVGNFDERVYKLTTSLLPRALWVLLTALSPKRLLSPGAFRAGLSDHVLVQGEVEAVRRLATQGTLVMVPTHASHLDSIILGYAVYLLGMPPLTYGAGLNLFTNPLVSFVMRNNGAYRVDRKKTSVLYKDILKEYATCAIEMGYHNLFFPGGTRSRSGSVERKLKKGLLGTAIRAYTENLRSRRPSPGVFVVPCTLSYMLVLEAETLIDDHLREVGKSRYIIDDDEFSKPRRVAGFLSSLVSLDSKIVVTFSRPTDVFGNVVDEHGRSHDTRGRVVDPVRYVTSPGGEPVHDDQRDAEYTRELAEAIVRHYARDNVVMATHVLGAALFGLLRRNNPGLDLYRVLRTGGEAASFPMPDVHLEVECLLAALRARGDGPRLHAPPGADAEAIVHDGLRYFATYHTQPAAARRGDRVFHVDRNLLLYYGNRLQGYELGGV
jgi:glycerol-3-phosphate O-acyltransferase